MAPIADSGNSASKRPLNNDSIDDYDVDDDPFAQLGIGATNNEPQSKKRKDATGLGIDEAVAVQKKPRAPNVKLDESRLLSAKGIPRLRRKACDLKFKGKGHEVGIPLFTFSLTKQSPTLRGRRTNSYIVLRHS